MPSQETLIPRSIKGFNLYIIKTTAYLLAGTPVNWSRFGWSAAEMADWEGFLTTWEPLFTLYSDRKGGYTTNIKNQLYGIIKACVDLNKSNHLLKSIEATRNVTVTDLETFNLSLANISGNEPHHVTARTAPATELVYPTLKPIGGGIIRCKCFTEAAASGRPKKLKGFDMIEYTYKVIAQATDKGLANVPTDPNDTTLTLKYTTKANFLLPTGTNNSGKIVCIFFRWVNSKHPDLNGPWNVCATTTIL